jgi:hypothetical protein
MNQTMELIGTELIVIRHVRNAASRPSNEALDVEVRKSGPPTFHRRIGNFVVHACQ